MNDYKGTLPYFNIIKAAQDLHDSTDKNIFGLPLNNDQVRLFDMLGYGLNSTNISKFYHVLTSFNANPFRLLAYQKVYFDHYRNPLYELNDPSAYNIDSHFGGIFDLTTDRKSVV